MRIIERTFSDREECPSVLLVNLKATSDLESNLSRMDEVINIAHEKSVNIVIFPELFVTGYVWDGDCLNSSSQNATELLHAGEHGKLQKKLKNIKESLSDNGKGLEYIFYNNARRIDNNFYNSTFILHPHIDHNDEHFIYDKIFLTPVEQKFFRQGTDKRLTIKTKWGTFGFLICYDLCFVELARKYAFQDHVDAIITMAHWRSEAVREYPNMNIMTDHYYGYLWNIMNASKAAYNQVWSLAANAVGAHDISEHYFWGGSGVWAPSGMPVIQASNITPELVIVRNLDIKGQLAKERDEFDYKIDFARFYKEICDEGSCPQKIF